MCQKTLQGQSGQDLMMVQHCSLRSMKVKKVFQIYRSEQNGWVYETDGLSPTIMVGCHSGVAPMIIEYEER